MKTAIVPILKNRQGDTSDKNNYRPIAIVIALSKIFELCIMRMIETHLVTSDNQFGFKREHGTDLCMYTVKSVSNTITCIIVLYIHVSLTLL